MASYVADHIRVICPSGLLRSTNSFPMNLSLLVQRKVTKRKDTPTSLSCGFPHHSTLPTGRPDSPSRLDRAKFDVPVEFSLPKLNTSANFTGTLILPLSSPKTASLVGSIDQGRSIESCRAWMQVKTTRWLVARMQRSGIRGCSMLLEIPGLRCASSRVCEARAPGTHFLGYVFCASKKGNSLQQERNLKLVNTIN